jgi:hypothetical protein
MSLLRGEAPIPLGSLLGMPGELENGGPGIAKGGCVWVR